VNFDGLTHLSGLWRPSRFRYRMEPNVDNDNTWTYTSILLIHCNEGATCRIMCLVVSIQLLQARLLHCPKPILAFGHNNVFVFPFVFFQPLLQSKIISKI
jgi:hypothetical protein